MTKDRIHIFAFFFGLLFALGLGISGMTLPERVIGFLDVTGDWDPSLAFVMVGGIGVSFFAFKKAKSLNSPYMAATFRFGKSTRIDKKLIIGSALFGIGWGIAGLCPAPAVTSMATLLPDIFYFVAAMVVGMRIFSWLQSK